jgi:hypothetical protein
LAQVLVRILDHGFPFDLRGKTPYTYGSEHLPIGLLIRGSTVRARLGPLTAEYLAKKIALHFKYPGVDI